jgi:rubrerythrin
VPGQTDGVLTYQDIVIIAMKREEASRNLYADLAERFAGSDTGALFSRLSAEEAEHKLRFEKIYDDEILKDN